MKDARKLLEDLAAPLRRQPGEIRALLRIHPGEVPALLRLQPGELPTLPRFHHGLVHEDAPESGTSTVRPGTGWL